jgi:hypothetical protein
VKPPGLIGFGIPLILTEKTGGASYKEYLELEAVKADFAEGTEAYKAAAALFAQGDNRPAKIAIAAYDSGGAEDFVDVLANVYDRDWYFAIITSADASDIIAVGDYIEANGGKLFAARTTDLADLAAIYAKKYDRTFVLYHSDPAEVAKFPEAAWVGAAGAQPVGSVTWKFKRLVGIAADQLTATELNAVHAAGGNAYVTKAGDDVTSEGKVVSGEYIDVIMAKDWVQVNIEHSIQKLLNQSPKVPYTNAGIAQLEAATVNVLRAGFNQGIIAEDADGLPLYSTDFPTREETDPSDRAQRKYTGATFTFELAGAVHEATIRGTISV